MLSDSSTSYVIIAAAVLSLAFALVQFCLVSSVKIRSLGTEDEESVLLRVTGSRAGSAAIAGSALETIRMKEIHSAIETGASAFLAAEYSICSIFIFFFAVIVFFLVAWGSQSFKEGFFTALAFVLGAFTSIACGYIGMKVAVFSNVRTTISCQKGGYRDGFNCAFRGGGVVGFALTGLGLLVLYLTLLLFRAFYPAAELATVMGCVAGYGLGGSSIALFGRVGGGIYTKAADVGADLVGKVVHGIPEDDPRNPAVIADLVGDNVGDIAGMGADLFGSFAESTCAALVIASQTPMLRDAGWSTLCFPLLVSAVGVFVCFITSFLATDIIPVHYERSIEVALRTQLVVSTLIMLPATYFIAHATLPAVFVIAGVSHTREVTSIGAFLCVTVGALGGLLNGLFTEYYTSKEYEPVRELAESCTTGAATNIIYGLALGYKSVVLPVFCLAIVIYISFQAADLYGVSLAAVGMLSTLAAGLTIDGFGPISDNAGGIAEMAGIPPHVRQKTDALDAAGNTTAAIGKGFAIGSAALVSLALYGAFVTRIQAKMPGVALHVEILDPMTFAFLLIGSSLPYWFSAMTMKSVGSAAKLMIREVELQFKENPDLLVDGTTARPDYGRCVAISTAASLREMIAPGCLVICAPLITGTFFGVLAVYGLLTGAILSGVQLATSMSNTGGAWDNAKKYIGGGAFGGKGSDDYKAAVVGDTVGDPMKDTSGPSLNILMKLMAIISLVFADYFWALNQGRGLFNVPISR